jgi:hypothetical protein
MNRVRSDLHIHEQLLLLALRDEKGTLESRAGMYQYALGGAILSELLVEGCIAVGEDKKKLVDVVKIKRMYEPVLDECLGMIASAKRRRSASNWVSRFGQIKKLRHRVASGLCHRGILKDSEDKVLLFFTRRIYPTIDPGPERRLVGSLRKAIFSESRTLNPRTGILVALAHGTGLLSIHFDRKELKRRKRRLEEITRGDLIGGATRQAVQAAQAAAMAAITAVTIASTTACR